MTEDCGAVVETLLGEAGQVMQTLQSRAETCLQSGRFDLIEQISLALVEYADVRDHVEAWRRGLELPPGSPVNSSCGGPRAEAAGGTHGPAAGEPLLRMHAAAGAPQRLGAAAEGEALGCSAGSWGDEASAGEESPVELQADAWEGAATGLLDCVSEGTQPLAEEEESQGGAEAEAPGPAITGAACCPDSATTAGRGIEEAVPEAEGAEVDGEALGLEDGRSAASEAEPLQEAITRQEETGAERAQGDDHAELKGAELAAGKREEELAERPRAEARERPERLEEEDAQSDGAKSQEKASLEADLQNLHTLLPEVSSPSVRLESLAPEASSPSVVRSTLAEEGVQAEGVAKEHKPQGTLWPRELIWPGVLSAEAGRASCSEEAGRQEAARSQGPAWPEQFSWPLSLLRPREQEEARPQTGAGWPELSSAWPTIWPQHATKEEEAGPQEDEKHEGSTNAESESASLRLLMARQGRSSHRISRFPGETHEQEGLLTASAGEDLSREATTVETVEVDLQQPFEGRLSGGLETGGFADWPAAEVVQPRERPRSREGSEHSFMHWPKGTASDWGRSSTCSVCSMSSMGTRSRRRQGASETDSESVRSFDSRRKAQAPRWPPNEDRFQSTAEDTQWPPDLDTLSEVVGRGVAERTRHSRAPDPLPWSLLQDESPRLAEEATPPAQGFASVEYLPEPPPGRRRGPAPEAVPALPLCAAAAQGLAALPSQCRCLRPEDEPATSAPAAKAVGSAIQPGQRRAPSVLVDTLESSGHSATLPPEAVGATQGGKRSPKALAVWQAAERLEKEAADREAREAESRAARRRELEARRQRLEDERRLARARAALEIPAVTKVEGATATQLGGHHPAAEVPPYTPEPAEPTRSLVDMGEEWMYAISSMASGVRATLKRLNCQEVQPDSSAALVELCHWPAHEQHLEQVSPGGSVEEQWQVVSPLEEEEMRQVALIRTFQAASQRQQHQLAQASAVAGSNTVSARVTPRQPSRGASTPALKPAAAMASPPSGPARVAPLPGSDALSKSAGSLRSASFSTALGPGGAAPYGSPTPSLPHEGSALGSPLRYVPPLPKQAACASTPRLTTLLEATRSPRALTISASSAALQPAKERAKALEGGGRLVNSSSASAPALAEAMREDCRPGAPAGAPTGLALRRFYEKPDFWRS